MQDAITNVINQADVQGLYLDSSSMGRLEQYFASGELRVRAAATISANASAIIKEAVAKSLLYSDITRPGGNMYTCRRYAACIRDLDYYLRYATYAMLAGDTSILDERVLNGSLEAKLITRLRDEQAPQDERTRQAGCHAAQPEGIDPGLAARGQVLGRARVVELGLGKPLPQERAQGFAIDGRQRGARVCHRVG